MRQDSRTERRKLGDIGENIACEFLAKRGFIIVERNYLRKWGEIDIVAKKGSEMRFIEVKSISISKLPIQGEGLDNRSVGREDAYRPEDNMHPWKLKRLSRAIQTYLLVENLDSDWQLDLVTVKIDQVNRKARVELIENIVI